jgi:hypothetical protein
MKHSAIYCFAVVLIVGLMSCAATTTRKTASYYKQNKKQISEMRSLYEQLYRHQPFSAGFTDKSCKYFLMEVRTDTVRYIYNTEKNKPQVYQTIHRFQYNSDLIQELTKRMRALKCLWISKSSFFMDEKRETITYLSFKSAARDQPFVENKYYILMFLNHPINSPEIKARIRRGDLVKIDELVYFTIGSGYR